MWAAEFKSTEVSTVCKLGDGTYGDVYKLANGLAGKCYKYTRTPYTGLPRDAVKEIALMAGLKSRYIVPLRGTVLNEIALWCITDCAPHGDLRNYMEHQLAAAHGECGDADTDIQPLTVHAADISYQIFAGLAYLHSQNVVHRDLKPENLLVYAISPSVIIKIADLGSALVHGDVSAGTIPEEYSERTANSAARTSPISTLWYRSPEIALHVPNMHGPPMDVWAAGMIVCELFRVGQPVFKHANTDDELVFRLFNIFGVPSLENALMPCYSSLLHTHSRAQTQVRSPKAQTNQRTLDLLFSNSTVPKWALSLVISVLDMEPCRRASARECARALADFAPEVLSPLVRRMAICDSGSGSNSLSPKVPSAHACPRHSNNEQALKIAPFCNRCSYDAENRVCGITSRAMVGDILYEMCMQYNPVPDRRVFHTAARLFDSKVGCPGLSNGETERKIDDQLPVLCAASVTLASKLCESSGMDFNWGPRLKKDAILKGKKPRLIDCCVFKNRDVVQKEIDMLESAGWDIWADLVIDVPVPKDIVRMKSAERYNYVCDMLVSLLGTNECTPQEMSETAALITRAVLHPRGVHVFPAKLIGLLECAVDALNSPIAERSSVKEDYDRSMLVGKLSIDFDAIKWF